MAPFATPVDEENPHPFPGRRAGYDTASYRLGLRVEAAYEGNDFVPDPFHSWQNIVDFGGRRYLFHYDRSEGRVYDVTDVRRVTVVQKLTRDDVKAESGVNKEAMASRDWQPRDFWGASSIQWNAKLQQYVMVQSFEQKRQVSEVKAEPPPTSSPTWPGWLPCELGGNSKGSRWRAKGAFPKFCPLG